MPTDDADVAVVVRLELELLDPAIRADPHAVRARLHPKFREVSASGRVWDTAAVTSALALEGADDPIDASDMEPFRLAPDVILLTYTTRRAGRLARRSSIWARSLGQWQLRYHQGTIVPDDVAGT
jgi:ribonuclease HI